MVDKWRDTQHDQHKDTEFDQWKDTAETTATPTSGPPTTEAPTSPGPTTTLGPTTTELPTSPPPSLPPTTAPPPSTESPAEAEARIRRMLDEGAQAITWISGPAWTQEVQLDNRNYLMRAIWNDLYEYWTLDILSESGAEIIAGLKLVPNWELIRRYQSDDLPPGRLTAFNVTGSDDKIGYTSLLDGDTVLIYEPAEQ